MLNPSKLKRYIWRCFLAGFCLTIISCDQGMSEQQMLQKAKTYLDNGDLKAASIELRNTLQKNNKNAEARFLLGNISLQIGDLKTAMKEFRGAAEAGWSNEQIQPKIAQILLAQAEFEKLLNTIVNKDAWSANTRANISGLRALAEAGLGHTALAKITLAEGKKYDANAFQVLKTTAIFQLSGIQDGNASNTLNTALSLFPDNTELLLLHASVDVKNKNHTQAADTFKKIISLEPSNLITSHGRKARIGLARLQIIDKNNDAASATLEPLLKRNNKDPEVNFLSGLIALSQGDYKRAEDHVRKILSIAPGHNLSQQLMGKIKYALKDYEQATHHLSAYLSTTPDDIAISKLLTNAYLNLNQLDQARSTLQSVLSLSPDDAGALVLLSQIEFNSGNMNAGIQALNKAIKSSPDNIELHKKLAKAYIATGKTQQALNELQTFQKLSNDIEETQKLTIAAYVNAGDTNSAINVASEMLEKDPQNPNLIALKGTLYATHGDMQQAREYLNKALKLEDNLPSAAIGLARVEAKEGHPDKAIELYKGLVDSGKGGAAPMLGLAALAANQERTNDMLSWLEKARSTAPDDTKSRIILANYYIRNNLPEKAGLYIQEAIKASPEQADLIALHGKVLIAQKRFNEALPPLKKLVNKVPGSANARVLLGEAYLHLGTMDKAREHLQEALNIQPNHLLSMILMAEIELKEGKPDRSLAYAKNLQRIQPQLYIGYMLEGDSWVAKQDNKKARTAFNIAWHKKQTADLAIKLFNVSKHSVKLEVAIKPLLVWLSNNPNDSKIRFILATAYQSEKQNDKAIVEYEKILEEKPDNGATLNNLAWLYAEKGDPKALGFAEKAYQLLPESPDVLDSYGWILVQHDQAAKGQRLIKQAMEQLPDNLEIRYHYATALINSGNSNEGQQILEDLLRNNTQFNGRNEAQQLLRKLKTGR